VHPKLHELRRLRSLATGQIKQPLRVIPLTGASLLATGYILIRSTTVESALVRRYAYCGCCNRLPTLSETYARVLNPIAFYCMHLTAQSVALGSLRAFGTLAAGDADRLEVN
jgi:hypothetical protein